MSKHGTTAGYVAHRRKGETACPECKVAWRAYYSDLRAKKRSGK